MIWGQKRQSAPGELKKCGKVLRTWPEGGREGSTRKLVVEDWGRVMYGA